MRTGINRIFFFTALAICLFSFTAEYGIAKTTKESKTVNDQLFERIDFGNSYILGQSIKSGAVYLLQRKKSDIESMLKTREHYREEILEDFTVKDLKLSKDKKAKRKN